MQKNLLIIISFIYLLLACGCALIFPTGANDFPDHDVYEVWSLTASAEEAWCREGKHNGLHISKVRVGGNYDAPPMPNPEGPGKISKQYIKYKLERTMPGSKTTYNETYGVTFTFYTMDDGIVYRCRYVDKWIY